MPSSISEELDGGSIWYAFMPAASGTVSAAVGSSSGGPLQTWSAAYTGNSLAGLTQIACGGTFHVDAGTTYHFQVGTVFRGPPSSVQVRLALAPDPAPSFDFLPADPTVFDTVQFADQSLDPGGVGIGSQAWDLGDGTTATGCCPTHRYAADGDYTVELTVTTLDGRSGSTSRVVSVRTPPTGSTCGEGRGDGRLATNSQTRFVFSHVKFASDASAPSGVISFSDLAADPRLRFESTFVTSLVITGSHVRLAGTGIANGLPVDFVVEGDDASPDTFSIVLSNGYSASGAVSSGRGVNLKLC